MDVEYHLSLGAHLLLWAFPLVIAAGAVAAHLIEGRRQRP